MTPTSTSSSVLSGSAPAFAARRLSLRQPETRVAPRIWSALGRELGKDQSGAAMVEFAMAIMPVLLVFFGMMQWSINAYLNLIVKHAAFSIVRCEAVTHPGMGDSGDENADCLATDPGGPSVIGKLFSHVTGVSSGDFTIDKTLVAPTAQTLDSVTVTLNYKCSVPLGNTIACTGGVQKLTATAKFPNQGSVYQPIWNTGG